MLDLGLASAVEFKKGAHFNMLLWNELEVEFIPLSIFPRIFYFSLIFFFTCSFGQCNKISKFCQKKLGKIEQNIRNKGYGFDHFETVNIHI